MAQKKEQGITVSFSKAKSMIDNRNKLSDIKGKDAILFFKIKTQLETAFKGYYDALENIQNRYNIPEKKVNELTDKEREELRKLNKEANDVMKQEEVVDVDKIPISKLEEYELDNFDVLDTFYEIIDTEK